MVEITCYDIISGSNTPLYREVIKYDSVLFRLFHLN